MDFLSGWLKSVVLVILIATFVDLLLPNQSMQRYVKTVISLFLLMTLLQPLLSLLSSNTALEERLTAALLPAPAVSGGEMESLAAIRQRAGALQARQLEQTSALVENQVEELIKRKLEQSADVAVRSVQVVTEPDEAGQPVIRKVLLQVTEDRPAEPPKRGGSKQVASMEAIKPVEPVAPLADIRIIDEPVATAVKPQSAEPGRQQEPLSPALLQKKTQMIRMLEQDWQLTQEQIELTLEPASGG